MENLKLFFSEIVAKHEFLSYLIIILVDIFTFIVAKISFPKRGGGGAYTLVDVGSLDIAENKV